MSLAAIQTGAKRTACDDRPVLLQQNPNVGIKIVADETAKQRATWLWEVYVKELWNIVKDVKGVWLIGICRRDATRRLLRVTSGAILCCFRLHQFHALRHRAVIARTWLTSLDFLSILAYCSSALLQFEAG